MSSVTEYIPEYFIYIENLSTDEKSIFKALLLLRPKTTISCSLYLYYVLDTTVKTILYGHYSR